MSSKSLTSTQRKAISEAILSTIVKNFDLFSIIELKLCNLYQLL
jgi:hypothetical protein